MNKHSIAISTGDKIPLVLLNTGLQIPSSFPNIKEITILTGDLVNNTYIGLFLGSITNNRGTNGVRIAVYNSMIKGFS